MAQQQLNGADIGSGLEQMHSEGVPQTVRGSRFGNGTTAAGLLTRLLHGILADVPARNAAWKEPRLGLFYSPPLTQDFQQLRRQHHVAILLTFTLIDANHHPRAVNVRYGESNRFRDAQAGRVARGQDGAMLGAGDAVEKLENFLRAQDYG